MILRKLTEEIVSNIRDKKIYCYEKSEAYLKELEEQFALTGQIAGIVDDFKRNQGSAGIAGKDVEVVGSDVLKNIDFSEAVLIITSDYFEEAYDKICMIDNVRKQLNEIYYFANRETEIEQAYRQKYADRALENIIVFRSGPHASAYVRGMDFADNARALFEYMLKERYNKKYQLVWLVKNPEEFEKYRSVENVEFLSFEDGMSDDIQKRDRYYEVMCLAKYLFFTDAYGFARGCRKDQIRVQLWHGCGFKTRVNFVRCEKRYEYTTVISDLYAKIHADIYGLRDDQVLVTGYAKQDWLLHPVSEEQLKLLRIPLNRKYVFWLPTFRTAKESLSQLNETQKESATGLPILKEMNMLRQIEEVLEANNMTLIIKLHPFQDRTTICCDGFEHIILLENEQLLDADVQINELLGCADALISDYSSAAVDYLLLNRPIAFTLDDVEEYASGRGFVFDNIKDWLPGVEIYNFSDFRKFIEDIAADVDTSVDKRCRVRNEMYRYFDDGNCRRILESLNITI